MMAWYYRMAGQTKGRDHFIMPPSGTLYSYPGEMTSEVQALYVEQQNQQAKVMNTSGSVHWEWILQWDEAWKTYFPRYQNATTTEEGGTRSFFLNDVPWPIPIPDMFLDGEETFRWSGPPADPTSVVGFRPSFNWQENGASGGLPWNASVIADIINTYLVPGTVQYIYVIQNTELNSVFEMTALLAPHVRLVNYEQLIALARVAPPKPHTPPTPPASKRRVSKEAEARLRQLFDTLSPRP